MFTDDQRKKIPPLPVGTNQLSNGRYTVPCHDEKLVNGNGYDIVYEKWFQTPVCFLLCFAPERAGQCYVLMALLASEFGYYRQDPKYTTICGVP